MERLTQRLVIEAEGTRHRMDPAARWCLDAVKSPLDCVQERHDGAGSARMPCGHPVCTAKAGGRGRRAPRRATTLRGALALAFAQGSDGELVGLDECPVTEFVAVGEPVGWCAPGRLAAPRRVARLGYPLALGVAQRGRLGQQVLRVRAQRGPGRANLAALLCCVAHEFDKDVAGPSALAASAPQDFGQCVVEGRGLTREDRGSAAAWLCDIGDERQRLWRAFDRVVAAVTR